MPKMSKLWKSPKVASIPRRVINKTVDIRSFIMYSTPSLFYFEQDEKLIEIFKSSDGWNSFQCFTVNWKFDWTIVWRRYIVSSLILLFHCPLIIQYLGHYVNHLSSCTEWERGRAPLMPGYCLWIIQVVEFTVDWSLSDFIGHHLDGTCGPRGACLSSRHGKSFNLQRFIFPFFFYKLIAIFSPFLCQLPAVTITVDRPLCACLETLNRFVRYRFLAAELLTSRQFSRSYWPSYLGPNRKSIF